MLNNQSHSTESAHKDSNAKRNLLGGLHQCEHSNDVMPLGTLRTKALNGSSTVWEKEVHVRVNASRQVDGTNISKPSEWAPNAMHWVFRLQIFARGGYLF